MMLGSFGPSVKEMKNPTILFLHLLARASKHHKAMLMTTTEELIFPGSMEQNLGLFKVGKFSELVNQVVEIYILL